MNVIRQMNGTHYMVGGDESKCSLAYGSILLGNLECILKSLVLNWMNRTSTVTAEDHTIIAMGTRSMIVCNLLSGMEYTIISFWDILLFNGRTLMDMTRKKKAKRAYSNMIL